MSDEEQVVAEKVVALDAVGPLTVRISQSTAEEMWRVDVSQGAGRARHASTTVAPGETFMHDLIQDAVSGEPVAWKHLARWGQGAFSRTPVRFV